MNNEFEALRKFDFQNSSAHLWIFKESKSEEKFRTWYIPTDDQLASEIKNIALSEMQRITEFSEYGHLAQTNENSCLAIDEGETDFKFLKTELSRIEAECRGEDISVLKGAKGYAVKFIYNGETVFAIKRSSSVWKTSYSKKHINMLFKNGELTAAEDNGFSIEKNFDFFNMGKVVFISDKRSFESMMQFREAYVQAFLQLQADQAFQDIFSDIGPIVDHVGTNAMHLRRMSAIADKAIYSHPNFLANLQRVNNNRNWGINFDSKTNAITPCKATARVILQVLLDHRLTSEITDYIYDVPDATPV